jgi:hypothetical protein
VAKRRVRRGHAVGVLAPRCVQDQVAAAGARFVPYHHAPEHDPSDPALDLPDVVVSDCLLLGGYLAAERAKVPSVAGCRMPPCWRGMGLKLGKNADAATLPRAMERVLLEPGFRAGARKVAQGMAAEPNDLAACEMEAVALRSTVDVAPVPAS